MRLATHIHSTWSDDGTWDLRRIRDWLRRFGYDGALVCDHDRTMTEERWRSLVAECRKLSGDGFLIVPGVEYQDPDHVVHLPVFGDVPFLGRSPRPLTVLAEADAAGAATLFAHPARRDAWRRFDPAWVPHLHGVEVWSRKYDGLTPNTWALETAQRFGLVPAVSLDFHGPRQFFPMSIVVDSPPEERAVVAALRTRQARGSVLGVTPDHFARGWPARTASGLERTRRAVAPRLRWIESKVRRSAD
ncbi:PHP domain-containing protein [Nocardioides sambongensis]|uniref:PHP domain-containing protein n=1 Tax=Nocardioides sambongensis TaxID=2589074 RepID=UPI001127A022|nr:PHP domain-containing protein [Nocardioides sambongensis]